MSNNLWPKFEASKIDSPKTKMLEQANFLSENTKNLLVGKVATSNNGPERIVHTFKVIAPAMANYAYNLFSVSHGPIYYPLTIHYQGKAMNAHNEEDLLQRMGEIFNDDGAKKVISSLLAQSME